VDLAELLDVLSLRPVAAGAFEGRSPAERLRAVYGGQFLAQGLMAAGRTVPDGRPPHSVHAYFVRAGDPTVPIRYLVDEVRDGRGFSHRHVRATQGEREVFRLLASFQVAAGGAEHDDPVPIDGVDPEALADYQAWGEAGTDNPGHAWYGEPGPVDIRIENPPPPRVGQVVKGSQRLWIRLTGQVPDADPLLHAALLAWLSDKTIADFAPLAHGSRWTDHGADSVSLDHAMWFLRPARADDWLLYRQDSPASGGGRGLTRGDFVARDGRRVASVMQEVLLSLPSPGEGRRPGPAG
jgi:acyl-CoA thioesterase-2